MIGSFVGYGPNWAKKQKKGFLPQKAGIPYFIHMAERVGLSAPAGLTPHPILFAQWVGVRWHAN